MATKTLGTNGTTTLTALAMNFGNAQADMAAINNAILSDGNTAGADVNSPIGKGQIWPGAWTLDGMLFIPNRGVLKVLPGDWVGVDSQGWPILVSANSIANGPWTHS